MTTLADAIARANLHDDPLRHVLEHIDASITRLEAVAAREALSEEALTKLCRFAATGSHATALEMIRAIDRRARWLKVTWWGVSLTAAALAGYLARGL